MQVKWRRWVCLTAALIGLGACTLLLDRGATQCKVDADCTRFGAQLLCKQGICVRDCFAGVAQTPDQLANACTEAQQIPYDNCAVGLCDADAGTMPPARGDGGTTTGGGQAPDPSTLPACADANEVNPGQVIYLTGSSNFPPLLGKLAPLIIESGWVPIYQVTSSCNGVKAIFSPTMKDHLIVDPAAGSSGASAQFMRADGTSTPCRLGSGGMPVDVGESDIFASTCADYGAPGNVGEYFGPIQAMLFVVPTASAEDVISAEAARAVFGRGGLAPWTNPNLFFVRNANTGTQQMIGRAIAVPADGFWGVDRGSAKNVDTLMRAITDTGPAAQAIGIISNDFYDADRGALKALAFKGVGQSYGYLPDSTQYKTDKQNVRDGHYPIWGPLHFFTTVSNGVPTSPGALAFVQVASVPQTQIEKNLFDAYITSGLVPSCAMMVQRTSELGALEAYAPPHPCGCYFEASPNINGSAPAECTKCDTANDCTDPARPACNLGYCEIR
jgi:hypothetical protein